MERYVDLEQIGIYSLAYQFAIVHRLVMSSINNPFITMFGRAADDQQLQRALPKMTTYFILATAVLGLGIFLMADDVIQLMAPPSYHSAGPLVPWLAVGFFVMALYFPAMDWMIMTKGSTKAVPLVTSLAAGLNIGLNLYFVPRFGIWAAAINTTVGYTVLAGLMLFVSQRGKAFAYEYGRLGKIAAAGALVAAAGMGTMRFEPLFNIAIGSAWLLLLPLALALLNFWTTPEKAQFIKLYQRFVPKVGWAG